MENLITNQSLKKQFPGILRIADLLLSQFLLSLFVTKKIFNCKQKNIK